MPNGQFGRRDQPTAGVRIPPAGWLSAWLGADKGWSYRPRSWLNSSMRTYSHSCAQGLEAIRRTLAAGAIAPRLPAQLNQHLTQIADAMAAR